MLREQALVLEDWWSLGLGLGLFWPSGTMGSLLGIPLACAAKVFGQPFEMIIIIIITLVSWVACVHTYHKLGRCDHPSIVSDEVVGMVLALCWIPLSVTNVWAGFILFRLFDITKPWPIVWVDRSSGWGAHAVMLDDVLAGILANAVLQSTLYTWGF